MDNQSPQDNPKLPVIPAYQSAKIGIENARSDRPQLDVGSLYIHIPFCVHKCHYCDFYSLVDTRDRQPAFTKRLINELKTLAPLAKSPLRTVFVGGGTPSLLAPRLWEQLFDSFHSHYQILDTTQATEFTVECNPESTTPELLALFRASGVNRISMGAQSFNAEHLRTLERRHDPDRVHKVVEWARRAGIDSISVDLIYAVPGQTAAELDQDLRQAIDLGTDHLSCYTLTYEPGTAMTARRNRGEFNQANEDTEADMFEQVYGTLGDNGYERYETSNFAKPGKRCEHNLAYWRQDDWLAAGPSASAHIAGHRWKNTPRLGDYLDISDGGYSPVVDYEPRDDRRALREIVMTGLRLTEGIDFDNLLERASKIDEQIEPRCHEALRPWLERDLALVTGGRLAVTESGAILADGLARDIIGAIG